MQTHASRRFTLIELLVTIGILGILAAILLPVLARSKAEARQNECLNHLRQIHLAARMYMDDNDAVYAPGHWFDPFSPFATFRFWIEDVAQYLSAYDMTWCPAARQERSYAGWQAADGRLYGLYYNINFIGREFGPPTPILQQDIKDPEGTVEFCDGEGGCVHLPYLHTDLNPASGNGFMKIRFRHRRELNDIRFDGHAEAVRATRIEWWTLEKE